MTNIEEIKEKFKAYKEAKSHMMELWTEMNTEMESLEWTKDNWLEKLREVGEVNFPLGELIFKLAYHSGNEVITKIEYKKDERRDKKGKLVSTDEWVVFHFYEEHSTGDCYRIESASRMIMEDGLNQMLILLNDPQREDRAKSTNEAFEAYKQRFMNELNAVEKKYNLYYSDEYGITTLEGYWNEFDWSKIK